jgi:hypothetical protein
VRSELLEDDGGFHRAEVEEVEDAEAGQLLPEGAVDRAQLAPGDAVERQAVGAEPAHGVGQCGLVLVESQLHDPPGGNI